MVEVTRTQIEALVAANALTSGEVYKITDRGDRGIFLQALTGNKLSTSGTRIMLFPSFYEPSGIHLGMWHSAMTPSIGDKVIFNAHVWENVTGSVGSIINPSSPNCTLSADWVLIPKDTFSNGEYSEMVASIEYDFMNDWISRQTDKRNNVVGVSFNLATKEGLSHNPVDFTDWCYPVDGNYSISNNHAPFGIYNNILNNGIADITVSYNTTEGGIFNNKILEAIERNIVSGDICNNTCNGAIKNNIVKGASGIGSGGRASIKNNSNNGPISSNTVFGDIVGNTNNGSIRFNDSKGNISSNSNGGSVEYNTVKGAPFVGITSNSNSGVISNNNILGVISANTVIGSITKNSNTGNISNNSGTGSITLNTLAGNITGKALSSDYKPNHASAVVGDVLTLSDSSNGASQWQ